MPRTPIRVLLVDDSPLILVGLKKILAGAPDIEVVGTAKNGKEALELIPQLDPSIVLTDFHMPVMDGLELTREVMAQHPRPILVVSTAVGPEDSERVFELLQAGAIDVFPKPRGGLISDGPFAEQLVSKIKVVAGVFVFPRRPRIADLSPLPAARPTTSIPRIVAIGASTGGPQTLQTILTRLPANYAAPVVVVQHISPGFLAGLVDWLDAQCRLRVKISRSGETAAPGNIYFPQEDTHLVLSERGELVASHAPPIGGHRPSVTMTFNSVAERYGASALAVLLTGMGRDGADGLKAVSRAGGHTIAQDEASCVVYGMPKEAIEMGAARQVLPPPDIARALVRAVMPRSEGV